MHAILSTPRTRSGSGRRISLRYLCAQSLLRRPSTTVCRATGSSKSDHQKRSTPSQERRRGEPRDGEESSERWARWWLSQRRCSRIREEAHTSGSVPGSGECTVGNANNQSEAGMDGRCMRARVRRCFKMIRRTRGAVVPMDDVWMDTERLVNIRKGQRQRNTFVRNSTFYDTKNTRKDRRGSE